MVDLTKKTLNNEDFIFLKTNIQNVQVDLRNEEESIYFEDDFFEIDLANFYVLINLYIRATSNITAGDYNYPPEIETKLIYASVSIKEIYKNDEEFFLNGKQQIELASVIERSITI